MDLVLGEATMNLATDHGFANALYHVCNLKEGAALMAAPVCGSWVFVLLDSHGFIYILFKLS